MRDKKPDPTVECPNPKCKQSQKWSTVTKPELIVTGNDFHFDIKGCEWCGHKDFVEPYEVIWHSLESHNARLFMKHYEPDTQYRIADAYRVEPMGEHRHNGWHQMVARVLDKTGVMAIGKHRNLRTLHRTFLEVLVVETTNEEFKSRYQKELDRRDAVKKMPKPKNIDGAKKMKTTKHWGPHVPEQHRGWGKEHYD